ncbi:tRNA lysidine(34) synthetase TilS [Pseudoalteromonas sp. MQS005]|uniref:tRNA lysidine(34) synthetase TilS n=1 Tax=Pseudoalteromonas sp. MQS005 TaxID=1854052 RepID=UPI0007E4FB9A|nr:tRNA lysidine(34) synthetase TilS [Pseudoalteromonas sp. MQS005]
MHKTPIYLQVKKALNHYLENGQFTFTVALSGGVDSVVLLHIMHGLKQQYPQLDLSAIYVNHGLSDNAHHWQQFCQVRCEQLSIDFKAANVIIEPKSRTSIEAQAREARYQALDEHSPSDSVILLGQHLNDQVETFLLRLKRGSGLKGLGAMQQTRVLESGRECYRPLLGVKRSDIEAFAQQFNISHITDESNSNERFDRNFLRQQIVPKLAERFTGFEQCTARSIELLQQQQALLDEYTQQDLAQCINQHQALNIQNMAHYSAIRIANLLRAWLALFTHTMPSQKQLMQIISQAIHAKADAQMVIELSDGQIRRHQGYLYFVQPTPLAVNIERVTSRELVLNDGQILQCLQGMGIRAPKPDEQVSVRFNCNSARIKPLKKPGSNTLKHWFKDAKVAPWLRAHIPLIFYNDELVQVVGYFISDNHKDDTGFIWEYKS